MSQSIVVTERQARVHALQVGVTCRGGWIFAADGTRLCRGWAAYADVLQAQARAEQEALHPGLTPLQAPGPARPVPPPPPSPQPPPAPAPRPAPAPAAAQGRPVPDFHDEPTRPYGEEPEPAPVEVCGSLPPPAPIVPRPRPVPDFDNEPTQPWHKPTWTPPAPAPALAFPKRAPLAGGDLVLYRRPGCTRKLAGHVTAPESDPTAEVTGEVVPVRPARGGGLVLVPRADITPLHGRRLSRVQGRLALPGRPPRRAPLTVLPGARTGAEPAVGGAPAPDLRLVRCGPAPLRSVPKDPPRVRSLAFLAFVREYRCLGCDAPDRPVDAHHEGPRGVGQRADDLRCVPLCRACHTHYTDRGTLPGRGAEDTAVLFLAAQVTLLVEWHAHLMATLTPPALHTVPPRAERALLDLLDEAEVLYGHA